MSCCSSLIQGCSSCAAGSFCGWGYFNNGNPQCRLIPLVATTAVTYTANQPTKLSIPFLTLPTDRFILDVAQVLDTTNVQNVNLLEAAQSSGGATTTLPVYDRFGNYVTTESLALTILARRNRSMPWVESSVTRFRAVLGTNPARVNIIDCVIPPRVLSAGTPVRTPAAVSPSSNQSDKK